MSGRSDKSEAFMEAAFEMLSNGVFDTEIRGWILAGQYDDAVEARARNVGWILDDYHP